MLSPTSHSLLGGEGGPCTFLLQPFAYCAEPESSVQHRGSRGRKEGQACPGGRALGRVAPELRKPFPSPRCFPQRCPGQGWGGAPGLEGEERGESVRESREQIQEEKSE